jgi:hypothetical protein
MKIQFINNQLIMSLIVSSAFVAFTATFGTLYFRQKAFMHAESLKKIEIQCTELENENLTLSARIAQAQTPYHLKEKIFTLASQVQKEQIILRVRGWSEYKELFLVRNALAMGTPATPNAH